MKNKFINVALQEFLEGTKIDKETSLRYKLCDQVEESLVKSLSKEQIEKYNRLRELECEDHFHELERLVAFMFHFLQVSECELRD